MVTPTWKTYETKLHVQMVFLKMNTRCSKHVEDAKSWIKTLINRLTPNDLYMGRTAPLTSKLCILFIYSTNIGTEYFKHALYSPFFSLQNTVCFIMLTCLVPVLFTFYIQVVLKLKKNNSGAKGLKKSVHFVCLRCINFFLYFRHVFRFPWNLLQEIST